MCQRKKKMNGANDWVSHIVYVCARAQEKNMNGCSCQNVAYCIRLLRNVEGKDKPGHRLQAGSWAS